MPLKQTTEKVVYKLLLYCCHPINHQNSYLHLYYYSSTTYQLKIVIVCNFHIIGMPLAWLYMIVEA
jgi:hypothetical protein